MNGTEDRLQEFEAKMRAAGVSACTLRAFRDTYTRFAAGDSGLIAESSIESVESLPALHEVTATISPRADLLGRTVMLKLNGGLGTSMGLDRAKSLLPVRDGLCFLDFAVRQVQLLRDRLGTRPRFLLMNSFSTSHDTLQFLKRFPDLGDPASLEL